MFGSPVPKPIIYGSFLDGRSHVVYTIIICQTALTPFPNLTSPRLLVKLFFRRDGGTWRGFLVIKRACCPISFLLSSSSIIHQRIEG